MRSEPAGDVAIAFEHVSKHYSLALRNRRAT
jgi:hypothetical protein